MGLAECPSIEPTFSLVAVTRSQKCTTDPVDFDDRHAVTFNPEVKCGECGSIDYAQTIGLPRDERQGGVLIETHGGGHS